MLKAALGIVFFPFLVPISLIHFALTGLLLVARFLKNHFHFGGIICFFFAPYYWARKTFIKTRGWDGEVGPLAYAFVGLLGFAFFLPAIVILKEFGTSGIIQNTIVEQNYLLILASALALINVFSALYESGRAYWNWLNNKKSKQGLPAEMTTKPESKQDDDDDEDPIDNFMRLLNQIEGILNSDSFEETIKALLEEIEKLFKTGDLTFLSKSVI